MKKKTLIAIAAVLAVALVIAVIIVNAPQKVTVGIYRISNNESLDIATVAFMNQLKKEFGEKNVTFVIEDSPFGDTSMGFSIVENIFKNRGVELILVNSTPALKAVYASGSEIPVVGTAITEYASALGLENFNGVVGGNITGTSDLASPEEQVNMIIEVCPDAKRVGVIHSENEPNSIFEAHEIERYLELNGLESVCYTVASTHEVASVAEQAMQECDAIFLPADHTVCAEAQMIARLSKEYNKPVFTADEHICSICGVASLSVDYYELGVATAKMAAKILRGEVNISEMPIEYAESHKKYNKDMADFLGITLPSDYTQIK